MFVCRYILSKHTDSSSSMAIVLRPSNFLVVHALRQTDNAWGISWQTRVHYTFFIEKPNKKSSHGLSYWKTKPFIIIQ